MDLGAISSYLKDNQALPLSALGNSSGLSRGSQAALSGVSGGQDAAFSQLLEKLNQNVAPASTAAASSAQTGSSTPTLSNRKPVIDKTSELYEQCQELETFLVKTLISGMRKTIQKSDFIDTGFAGEMYEDMLYDEYARDYAKNAGFGLADLAYAELTGQRGKLIADHA
jgi:flagellar protein FlgJ